MEVAMDVIWQVISDPVQMIGYAGMICALLSYQFRKNKTFFLLQAGCAVAFTVQFMLLHSYAAMLMNIVAILRGLILAAAREIYNNYILSCEVISRFFSYFPLFSFYKLQRVPLF